jgi:hypothetical protein
VLFAQQYVPPDGSGYGASHAAYGVQMAVSPPARDIGGYGYGGGIDISGGVQHDEIGGSGSGYASGEVPPPQHYPGAHGFYGQDGQYYVNQGVVAPAQTGYEYQLGMQQGYYAGLQSGAYAAPASGVGPQMMLRVNTVSGGGDANGYAAPQQQQPQGGNAQHWQRHGNGPSGRGPERGRRRSSSGATGGKLQHSSGSGSSAHSFGSGDGDPGSPKVERHRGRRGRGGGNGGDGGDTKADEQQGREELSFEELSFAD